MIKSKTSFDFEINENFIYENNSNNNYNKSNNSIFLLASNVSIVFIKDESS